jgi:hypothetical protein
MLCFDLIHRHFLSALERERTITSVSLAEERRILKEIHNMGKSKTQVEEYLNMEKQVQEKKVRVVKVLEAVVEIKLLT